MLHYVIFYQVTTLWSTPLIIVSNVLIFFLVPFLSIHYDQHHHRSTQHLHMLLKMVFFQSFNTVFFTLLFLFLGWTIPSGSTNTCPLPMTPPLPDGQSCFGDGLFTLKDACVSHWYLTGAIA